MSDRSDIVPSKSAWLPRLCIGLFLVLSCWALSWGLSGLRTHLLFFPLWFGYCLVVDAWVLRQSGTSLMSRSPLHYAFLFLLSAPVWWVFEGFNLVTQNWIYLGRDSFSNLEYFFFASLSFSTVIPAVFTSAELLGTSSWFHKFKSCNKFSLQNHDLIRLHLGGWGMLLLLFLFPDVFFPFIWLGGFFILDPVNAFLGRRSLLREASEGNYRGLIIFGLAALLCGFFWELWNIHSFPKWIYDIPYLEFWHIFEMPLAGYGGYIPFGWELFAIYHLVAPRRWALKLGASSTG